MHGITSARCSTSKFINIWIWSLTDFVNNR
jgi:hypothetical protein